MPIIKDEVQSGTHLRQYRDERPLLVPFLSNFDVNSAYSRTAFNTRVSAYILAPDDAVKYQFGIAGEVLLIISDYPQLQPRTLQAVEQVMKDVPAAGRVDPTVFFLVTPDSNALNWMQNHGQLNAQTRIPVLFVRSAVSSNATDSYFVRRTISEQLYSRDLFNEQLPLQGDLFFFGRDKIVAETLVAVKQSQNRGLFGLRKTGKTSILFKVRRMAERDGICVLYYDCKDTALRTLHWDAFLRRIIQDLVVSLGLTKDRLDASVHVSDQFKSLLRKVKDKKKICIIFDEIEWVSPLAKIDKHWHTEFVDFWQTMWTAQSELRNVAYIIAGVNPTVVEMDEVAGVQNPVFSIVPPQYVTGLAQADIATLCGHIGQWMGLRFTQDAYEYIAKQYGGHPLLTRMACSHVHSFLLERNARRPASITGKLLTLTEKDREEDIVRYSKHVVNELSGFYPTEYEMLETLACGNVAEFIELSKGSDYTRHLRAYGLVGNAQTARPYIQIPMVGRYIHQAYIDRLGLRTGPRLVEPGHRELWLRDRISRITTDIRQLERVARAKGFPELYGENGFPEAERFYALEVIKDISSYQNFINVCNRCFVEPLDNLGSRLGKKQYFWQDVKASYPELWHALLRTKLYRHEQMHLLLQKKVEDQLKQMLDEDFLSTSPEQSENPAFALQQMVVDGLFVGVQAELESIT